MNEFLALCLVLSGDFDGNQLEDLIDLSQGNPKWSSIDGEFRLADSPLWIDARGSDGEQHGFWLACDQGTGGAGVILFTLEEAKLANKRVLSPDLALSLCADESRSKLFLARSTQVLDVELLALGEAFADVKVGVARSLIKGARSFSPDHIDLDAKGGIYFTDSRTGEIGGVYYIAKDNSLQKVFSLQQPRGLCLSADGLALFVAEHGTGRIMKYAIDGVRPIEASNIMTKPSQNAVITNLGPGPDGIALDSKGNVYATFQKGIEVLSPSLTHIGTLAGLSEPPSSCAFGGPDGHTLLVTAGGKLYMTTMKVTGRGRVGPSEH